jgi:acyl-CoA thioesterase I
MFRQFRSWISFTGFVAVAVVAPGQSGGTNLATASTPSKSILVLGDSLAAGYGLDPSEAFPAILQKKIQAAGLNFTVVNAGVSGDTSSGGLRRIDWSLKRRVDVLVLELGGNDGLRGISVGVTRTNLQAIIDRTRQKYSHVEVVLAGMQIPPNMGHEYTTSFAGIFPELAKVNQAALIPFLLEGVGGRPELNLPDRIHPTAAGHEIVADNAWKVLKPVLERMTLAKP